MPTELTERQRRLLDAVLILAVVALAFVVVADVGDGLLRVRRHPAAVLPRLAAVVRAAAADQRGRQRSRGCRRRGAVIIVYLTIVVVLLGDPHPGVRDARVLDQRVHPGRPAARGPADQPPRRAPGAARRRSGFTVDLVSQAPEIVANLQDVGPRARRARSSRVAVASIGVFGNILILVILSIYIAVDRDEIVRLPLPPRARRRFVPQARAAPDERLQVVRRVPPRPADHGPRRSACSRPS